MEKNVIIESDGRVLGSYLPNIKSMFVNASIYEVEVENNEKSNRVYFHESYHNWQSIFTPFGQRRWYEGQICIEQVVDLWGKIIKSNPHLCKIPIANMIDKDSKETIAMATILNMTCSNDEIIRIMQYGMVEDTLGIFSSGVPSYISPKIIYKNQDYILNGIDVIESLDKYQEALYGEFINEENFKDILNPDILKEIYYVPFLYYLDEVGDAALFPIVCEIALMSYELPDISDETSWKKNSPAWRFVNAVQLVKTDNGIPKFDYNNLNESYMEIVEYILHKMDYKSYQETYTEMFKEDNSVWSNPFITEMNAAVEFKKNYPAALAYPFMCSKECVDLLYKFEPHYLRYTDASIMLYERDSSLYGKVGANLGKWRSMLNVQLHKAALAFQIRGMESKRTIYYDDFQCGCGYFDVVACPFYPKVCNGYLASSEELEFKDDIDVVKKEVGKILEIRRDENIEKYDKIRDEMHATNIGFCPLDMIFKSQYGFGILDIEVDLKKRINMRELIEMLEHADV